MEAADFYVKELGFEITDKKSNMISLHGKNINFFIERGPALGPFLKLPSEALRKQKHDSKKRAAKSSKMNLISPDATSKIPVA